MEVDKFCWFYSKAKWCWERGIDQYAMETTLNKFNRCYDMKFHGTPEPGVLGSFKIFGVQFTFIEEAY